MIVTAAYPIGRPGQPWRPSDRRLWRSRQSRQRRYDAEVAPRVAALSEAFDTHVYGHLDYDGDAYDLFALRSRNWDAGLPVALVTGGVHGYETSGVMGAMEFLERRAARYEGRINLVAAPCVSPWGFERINRWTYDAIDPNRSFTADGLCPEAAALIALVRPLLGQFLLHIDLHETTDSDESEFRPALAARDGKAFEPGVIPDGFYLVAAQERPELTFQQHIIRAVAEVTHIAPPDHAGEIIGCPVATEGVIAYPLRDYGLCTAITGARYTTTTEVYPDSPRATAQQCNDAQVAAVCAALDYALAHPVA